MQLADCVRYHRLADLGAAPSFRPEDECCVLSCEPDRRSWFADSRSAQVMLWLFTVDWGTGCEDSTQPPPCLICVWEFGLLGSFSVIYSALLGICLLGSFNFIHSPVLGICLLGSFNFIHSPILGICLLGSFSFFHSPIHGICLLGSFNFIHSTILGICRLS